MKRYKFLKLVSGKIKSANGNQTWKLGEWKSHKGELDMCKSGLHCSKKTYQAFSYIQGEILAKVETRGDKIIGSDKEVWSEMRLIKLWEWQKQDSVALSIFAAELCIENFERKYPNDKRPREAIEAAKKWLGSPTKENELAARSAELAAWLAWSAARSAELAARSAARSAELAARSAAWSAELAAWSAWLAASSSSSSAIIKKISKWMSDRIEVLEEIK